MVTCPVIMREQLAQCSQGDHVYLQLVSASNRKIICRVSSRLWPELPRQPKSFVGKVAQDDNGERACPHRDGKVLNRKGPSQDDSEHVADSDQPKDHTADQRECTSAHVCLHYCCTPTNCLAAQGHLRRNCRMRHSQLETNSQRLN